MDVITYPGPKNPYRYARRNWIGPPQRWQGYPFQITGDVSPLLRLYRMGSKGLPVGKGSWPIGGLRLPWIIRMLKLGMVYVDRDPSGQIVRVYACQYSFEF